MSNTSNALENIMGAIKTLLLANTELTNIVGTRIFTEEDGDDTGLVILGYDDYPAVEIFWVETLHGKMKNAAGHIDKNFRMCIRVRTHISDGAEAKAQCRDIANIIEDVLDAEKRIGVCWDSEWDATKPGFKEENDGKIFERITDVYWNCYALIPRS